MGKSGVIVVALCAVIAGDVLAQSPVIPAPRRFDVASVKPTLSPIEAGAAAGRAAAAGGPPPAPPTFGVRTFPGGRLTANATLRALIASAYELKEYQIDGGPKWLGEKYFVIDARAGGGATPAELKEMMKALLAERFGLRGHTSSRTAKVYNLILARSDGNLGPMLKRTSEQCIREIEERQQRSEAPAAPAPPQPRSSASGPPSMTARCGATMMFPRFGTGGGAMTWSASGQPMSVLVERLASDLNGPVVDRTGLQGLFDFVVESEMPQTLISALPGLARPGLDANGTDSPKLPLRKAIEGQLGLKLDAADGPLTIFVVDAAEQPTPD